MSDGTPEAVSVCTGPWSLIAAVPPGVIVPVRTSLGVARYIRGARGFPAIEELIPTQELFSIGDMAEFAPRYRARLDGFGVARIQARFDALHERHAGQPLVLLCFEQDRRECHRGIFAAWWEERTGMVVPELTPAAAAELANHADSVTRHFRSGAVPARRTGACHLCADRISTGEMILKLGKRGSWVHLICAERGLQEMRERHE